MPQVQAEKREGEGMNESDYGPAERAQHGPLIKTARSQTEGGIITGHGLQAEYPTLLHELYATGRLRQRNEDRDVDKPRFEAGLWLQRCFVRAGIKPSVTINFETHGQFSVDESDDARAWNHKAYNDAMRAAGGAQTIIDSVCQAEHYYENPTPIMVIKGGQYVTLRHGLDRVAKFRGII